MMYNTALKGGKNFTGAGASFAETTNGVVLKHDITDGQLPDAFRSADVIYSEPAWPTGLKVFNKRAGRQVDAQDYYDGLNRCIAELRVPAIMICGKSVSRRFTGYSSTLPTRLNGDSCIAYLWNIKLPRDLHTEMDILNYLVQHFNCILDPCCGYGRVGEVFNKESGKHFVMSDYDSKCVGYLKNKYENISSK